jgi:hypothetical protein
VTLTVADGALGIVPLSTANVHAKMGICSQGQANVLYSFSDIATLKRTLGYGPLVDAAALALTVGGGPVYCIPLSPSTYGTASGVTKSGSGTGVVTVGVKNPVQVLVKIVGAGATGVATFVYSLDGGLTYSATPVVTAATVVLAGAPGITLAFTGTGSAFVAGDVWTITTAGAAALVGTGSGTCGLSSASPTDAYSVVITIVGAGALGVATFTYSLDGGNTFSGTIVVPAGGTYVLPNTGILVTFASGTYVVADSHTFTTSPASYTATDVAAAFTVLLADPRTWAFVHLVGQAASVAASATLFAAIDTQMATAAAGFRYGFCLMECPQDTDANILAGFLNSSSVRVAVAAGFAFTTSPITGAVLSRSAAWHVAARLSSVVPSESAAWVGRGPLVGIPGALVSGRAPLSRDEQATPGLDSGHFCTLRTIIGRTGYYITGARLLAPGGSDFQFIELRRVMDIACEATREGLLPVLNGNVRVTAATGAILEKDARNIEQSVGSRMGSSVVGPNYASAASVSLNRTQNILSTGILPTTVRVVPLGYARAISVDIGFQNPATKLS